MEANLLDLLEWYGAIASVIAAAVVATNISQRVTGWAFVIFVSSSAALIAWGFLSADASGIGWQNIFLLAINLWGVYRYLIHGNKRPRSRTDGDN